MMYGYTHIDTIHKMAMVWLLIAVAAASTASAELAVPGNRLRQTLALRESLGDHYYPSRLPPEHEEQLMASVCVAQSILARYSFDPWSLRMWDSSGTSVVGTGAGAHQARGHQDLCTSVLAPAGGSLHKQLDALKQLPKHVVPSLARLNPLAVNMTTPPLLTGRYCIVTVRAKTDTTIFATGSSELLATFSSHNSPSYATCVPDTCSEDLLQTWFQEIEGKKTIVNVKCTTRSTVLADNVDLSAASTFVKRPIATFLEAFGTMSNSSKQTNEGTLFTTIDTNTISLGTVAFCSVMLLLVVIVFSATALDYFHQSAAAVPSRTYDLRHPAYATAGPVDHLQHQIGAPATQRGKRLSMYIQTAPPVYGWDILQCFSIPQNWQRIFPSKPSSSAIPVIDGLRCISMFWVIIVHRYMLMLITSSHPGNVLKNRQNPSYWWLFNAYPSVDIFFLISGFLLAITPLPRPSFKGIISACFIRYLRLVPSVIMTVWGVSTAFSHMGSGPVWDNIYNGLFGDPCQKTWLSSLLLASNVNHANDMCLGHLWSLSIDWQLSIVGILVFLPLAGQGSFLRRYLPLLLLTVVTIVVPFFVTLTYNLPAVPSVSALSKSLDFYNHYYISTWCRAAPYCIGLLAGRLHLWLKEHPEALTQRIVRLGHPICFGAVCCVMMSPILLQADPNLSLIAVHNSLAKPAFAGALAFLIITSCHGQGGMFGWLLTRPFVGVMARASYCIYLTSLPVQVWAAATSSTLPTEGVISAYMAGGDMVVSVLAGIVLTLLVEMPFARMLGNVLKKGKRASYKPVTQEESSHNSVKVQGKFPSAEQSEALDKPSADQLDSVSDSDTDSGFSDTVHSATSGNMSPLDCEHHYTATSVVRMRTVTCKFSHEE